MARTHGKLLTRIWNDPAWLKLPVDVQWAYEALISQPNLNRAGILPVTLARWTRLAAGLDTAIVEKLLQVLEDAELILVDRDTDELLVRSFVRNDETWRQPKVWPGTVDDALSVVSPRLRAQLLREVLRLDMSGVKDTARPDIDRHLERLVEGLQDVANLALPGVSDIHPHTPSDTRGHTHPDTHTDTHTAGVSDTPSRDARATPPPPTPTPPVGLVDRSSSETQRTSTHARGSPMPWPDEPPF